MNLYEERPLLVLVDAQHSIILGTVPTAACGQMLMLGLLNTQMNHLPIQVPHRKTAWDEYDFNDLEKVYLLGRGWMVTPAASGSLTPALTQRRKMMRLRAAYLYAWEVYCQGALIRFKGYMSDAVQAFVRHELERRMDSGYIQEYASIHEITLENAVQELNSKVQSLGTLEARNWAQYEKIAQIMAVAGTPAELDACMTQGFDVLYRNAYV